MEEFWQVAVGVAGLGAIGSFVIWSIYRQWLSLPIFQTMTKDQQFRLFRLVIVLTFVFSILALVAYLFSSPSDQTSSLQRSLNRPNLVVEHDPFSCRLEGNKDVALEILDSSEHSIPTAYVLNNGAGTANEIETVRSLISFKEISAEVSSIFVDLEEISHYEFKSNEFSTSVSKDGDNIMGYTSGESTKHNISTLSNDGKKNILTFSGDFALLTCVLLLVCEHKGNIATTNQIYERCQNFDDPVFEYKYFINYTDISGNKFSNEFKVSYIIGGLSEMTVEQVTEREFFILPEISRVL